MKILTVENLSKVYGKGDTAVKALDGVSFEVERGEFVAIVGPSGSGKSTLLHILGGVDRPSGGRVLIEDTDIYRLDETNLAIFRRRQVGLIYQFYNLIPILNVEENITLPLLLDQKKVDRQFLQELLSILNLLTASTISQRALRGEQQRVSIGRALINQPALVLAMSPPATWTARIPGRSWSCSLSNKRYHQTLIVITTITGLPAGRPDHHPGRRAHVKDEVVRS